MDEHKKTGLGASLLLQRTETSPTPERADAPDVSGVQEKVDVPGVSGAAEVPKGQTSGRPKRSRSLAGKKSERMTLRDRVTLYLDREVNEWLDLVARVEGRERSEVVTDLLRARLPKYRIETGE